MGALDDPDYLWQNRNTLAVHSAKLNAAAKFHDEVRARAEAALLLDQQRVAIEFARLSVEQSTENAQLLEDHAKAREEIAHAKARAAKAEIKAREAEREASDAQRQAAEAAVTAREAENKLRAAPTPPPRASVPHPQHATPPAFGLAARQSTPAAPPCSIPATEASTLDPSAIHPPASSPAPSQPGPIAAAPPSAISNPGPTPAITVQFPDQQRYIEIHSTLKELRKHVLDPSSGLKKQAGEWRRTIKMTVGQLVLVLTSNKKQFAKITEILKAALDFGGPTCDPVQFLVHPPTESKQGDKNTGELPLIFIYCLNILSKAICNQGITEASAKSAMGDPIGAMAHQSFSNPLFLWRGVSFIDILISKFWKNCPAVFGIRGSEQTEAGRTRLGWKKENGKWATEQEHIMRMNGLASVYAAICMRNYSRSQRTNPWPQTHYWFSLASITSTPPSEASATQYIVLRALLEDSISKFLLFYGNMAKAALRVAIVDFPQRALDKNMAAVQALMVLGDKLKAESGLDLNRLGHNR